MTYRALAARASACVEVPITFTGADLGAVKMCGRIALEAAVNIVSLRRLGRTAAGRTERPVVFPVGPRRDVAALASEARG